MKRTLKKIISEEAISMAFMQGQKVGYEHGMVEARRLREDLNEIKQKLASFILDHLHEQH